MAGFGDVPGGCKMKRSYKIAGAVVLALVVVIFVGGWLALQLMVPGIIRDQLQVAVRDGTQMEVEVGRVRLQGLSGFVLHDVYLTERERPEVEVAYLERVELHLEGIPWPWADLPAVEVVRLVRPRALLVTEPDGRLNLARLLVPDVPPEEVEPAPTVRRVVIEQADLRYIDQSSPVRPADAGPTTPEGATDLADLTEEERRLVADHLVELADAGDWPGAQLVDVDALARLVDEQQQAYDFSISIGDGTLGAGAIEGRLVLEPFALDLRTTDPLNPTPQSLSGIPWLTEDLLTQLHPSAQISIERFNIDQGRALPVADVRVSNAAFTVPGANTRLRNIGLLASLDADGMGRIVLAQAQPVPEGGRAGEAPIDAPDADGDPEAADEPVIKGEILIERLDRWNENQRVVGTMDLQNFQISPEGFPGLTLNGRMNIGYHDPTPGEEGGRRLAMMRFRGELLGGADPERPLRVPVSIELTGDADGEDEGFVAIDRRFAVVYNIGDAERPLSLTGNALVDMDAGTVTLERTTGHVDFSTALLAQAAGVTLAQLQELQPRGRIDLNLAGTVINLDDPLDSLLNVVARSEELRFIVPQTEEERRLTFESRVVSVPDDPDIRYRATARVNEIGTRGALQATAIMDGAGEVVAGEATIVDLPLPGELILTLQPALAARVQQLAGVINGNIRGRYTLATGEFSDYTGQMRVAGGRARILVTPEAPVDVGLVAEVDLAPEAIDGRADLAAMDGIMRLTYAQRPQQTTATLGTLRDQAFDLALMPQALKEKLGPVPLTAGRVVILPLELEAPTPTELLMQDLPIQYEIFQARADLPRAGEPLTLIGDILGQSRLNVAAGTVTESSLRLTQLTDAAGGRYMPQGASLLVEVEDFTFHAMPQMVRATVSDWPGTSAMAVVRLDDGRLIVDRLNIDAQLNRTNWAQMAGPLQAYAPSGRLTANATAARETDGSWSAVNARAALDDVSWRYGETRADPLSATLTINRRQSDAPLTARLLADDAEYGGLDVTLTQNQGQAAALDARLDEFILSRQLTAMVAELAGSAQLAEAQPSGVFSGRVRGNIAGGPLRLTNMSGVLNGENIAGIPGGLPVERGVLRSTIKNDALLVESFEAVAGRGTLVATGQLGFAEGFPFTFNAQARNIDLRSMQRVRDLGTDRLSGLVNADFVRIRGLASDVGNTLQGQGEAIFFDGYLWPLPLFDAIQGGVLQELGGLLRGRMEPTAFRSGYAVYRVNGGRLQISESYFDSQLMRLVMDGDIMLDGRLDLHVASSLNLDMLGAGNGDGNGGFQLPQLDERVQRGLDLLRNVPGGDALPLAATTLHITGTFGEPRAAADPRRAIAGVRQPMRDFLNRRVDITDLSMGVAPPRAEPGAEEPAADGQPGEAPQAPQPSPPQPETPPAADDQQPEERPRRPIFRIPLIR